MPTTIEEIANALRLDYREAVQLCAREETLAGLAEDTATARLHGDTARFHHGSAHAFARALKMVLYVRGEEEEPQELDVHACEAAGEAGHPGGRHHADAVPRAPLPHLELRSRFARGVRGSS